MSSFLGRGWAFPVTLDEETGGIRRTAEPDGAVNDAVRMILGTALGERVMRPDFGCRIQDHVFALVDSDTAGAISLAVGEALAQWEPRIDVLEVATTPDPADERRLNVAVSYRNRTSNSRVNLVYPFYLE